MQVQLSKPETRDALGPLVLPSGLFFKRSFKWMLVVCLTSLNYVLTYDLMHLGWVDIYYYLSDTFLTFLIIEFYILGIRWLDKKLPWNRNLLKRLIIQLGLQTPVVLAFIILINVLLELIIYTGRINFAFYTFDMVIILVFVLLIQFIYLTLHFVSNPVRSKSRNATKPFAVSRGKQTLFLKEEQILAAFVEHRITFLVGHDHVRYNSDINLKMIEERLSPDFFRANRQFIISRDFVQSYQSDAYGKVTVLLNATEALLPDKLTVSRDKAHEFRQWVSASSD